MINSIAVQLSVIHGARRKLQAAPVAPVDQPRQLAQHQCRLKGGRFMFHHGFGLSWLVVAAIIVVPFWRICTKVGYSPWLSLLIVVPLVNIGFVYFLAFSEWPSQKTSAGPGGTTTSTPV
jgi:hypothetical protein